MKVFGGSGILNAFSQWTFAKFEALAILIGLILLAFCLRPAISTSDDQVRYEMTQRLDEVLRESSKPILNQKFSYIQPLLALPLYEIGSRFGKPRSAVAYFNLMLFFILLTAIWRFFPSEVRGKIILLLMSASMFPLHLQVFFGEPLGATMMTLGFMAIENNAGLACLCFIVGVAAVPATIPAFALAVCFTAVTKKRWAFLLFALAPAAVHVLETYVVFHSFSSPYLSESAYKTVMPYSGLSGFSYPAFFGILSILFSFGKGLLFFIPGLTLASSRICRLMDHKRKDVTVSLLILVGGLVLVYSRWWAWYGGVFWGPRFFLVACIPASITVAYALSESRKTVTKSILLLTIMTLSTWGCVQGFAYGLVDVDDCLKNRYALELLCWYTPEWSPLWRQFVIGFPSMPAMRLLYVIWIVFCFCYLVFYVVRTTVMPKLPTESSS